MDKPIRDVEYETCEDALLGVLSDLSSMETLVNRWLYSECPNLRISLRTTIAEGYIVITRAETKQRPNWWQRIRWAITGGQ